MWGDEGRGGLESLGRVLGVGACCVWESVSSVVDLMAPGRTLNDVAMQWVVFIGEM